MDTGKNQCPNNSMGTGKNQSPNNSMDTGKNQCPNNSMGTGKARCPKLLWLFGLNLYISAFTFGGGYVVIPMIRKYFVQERQLFDEDTLLNMAAIAQSSPGAIAVNLSVLAGYRVSGMSGALVSCLGAVLPPLAILSLVTLFYDAFRSNPLIAAALNGMEAGAAALVIDVVVDMMRAVLREGRLWLTVLTPLTFAFVFFLHLNPGWVIVGAAVTGAVAGGFSIRKCGRGCGGQPNEGSVNQHSLDNERKKPREASGK